MIFYLSLDSFYWSFSLICNILINISIKKLDIPFLPRVLISINFILIYSVKLSAFLKDELFFYNSEA